MNNYVQIRKIKGHCHMYRLKWTVEQMYLYSRYDWLIGTYISVYS